MVKLTEEILDGVFVFSVRGRSYLLNGTCLHRWGAPVCIIYYNLIYFLVCFSFFTLITLKLLKK